MDNNSSSIGYQRRCAVSKAWKRERSQILQSRGSRNWSQKEQKEIIATGKCHGYEGQHMLSVKEHPDQAGNDKNIQFLTHEEHFRAHSGNWKNDANGRYNYKTQKVDPLDGKTPDVKYRRLSNPLTDKEKNIALKKYEGLKKSNKVSEEEQHAGKHKVLPVHKTDVSDNDNKMDRSRSMFNAKTGGNMVKNENFQNLHNRISTMRGETNGNGNTIGV